MKTDVDHRLGLVTGDIDSLALRKIIVVELVTSFIRHMGHVYSDRSSQSESLLLLSIVRESIEQRHMLSGNLGHEG